MKKIGVVLLTGALAIGLAACGGKSEGVTPKTSTETKTTVNPTDVQAGDKVFTITGKNWDFASDKELVVKKGDKVTINLKNGAGFHTIGNEELGIDVKADAPVTFTADKAGEYELSCTTVCGGEEDHTGMKIKLIVVE